MSGYQAPQFNSVVCNGCSTTLAYPLGAPSVRCPICEVVTPAVPPEIRIQCIRCQTPLVLPVGTTLALCPICGLVMRVPARVQPGPHWHAQHPTQQPPREEKCMVYVENPPTMVNGKLVSSVSVGTKLSDTPAPPGASDGAPPPPPPPPPDTAS